MISEEKNRPSSNMFLKKLSQSKISDLMRYIYPNSGQCMVTETDNEQSVFRLYFFSTDTSITVTLDDFECVVNKSFLERGYMHSMHSCTEGGQLLRFYAWMFRQFGETYLQELAAFLKRTYAGR